MSGLESLVISSLDIPDAPAKAVIAKNNNARALRLAEETRQELTEISDRVELTLHNYEFEHETCNDRLGSASFSNLKTPTKSSPDATMEFVDDLSQLISIISDPLAKRKYQQFVSIFVVGYENTCCSRLELLKQINEFFHYYGKEKPPEIEFPDFNIDQVGVSVRASLKEAEETQKKLKEVSKEVAAVLHKLTHDKNKSSKRKLEKELLASREQILSVTDKLMAAQQDLTRSDERISTAFHHLEVKQVEIERLKSQVEASKRKHRDTESLQKEVEERAALLQNAREEISKLMLDISQLEAKLVKQEEHQRSEKQKQENTKLEHEAKVKSLEEKIVLAKRDVQNLYEKQISDLRYQNRTEMDSEKTKHRKIAFDLEETILKLKRDLEEAKKEQENTVNKFLTEQAHREIDEKEKTFKDSVARVVNHEKQLKSIQDVNRLLTEKMKAEENEKKELLKEKQKGRRPTGNIKTADVSIQTDLIAQSDTPRTVEEINFSMVATEPIKDEDAAKKPIEDLTAYLVELRSKYNQNVMLVSKLLKDKQKFTEDKEEFLKQIKEANKLKEEAETELLESLLVLEQLKMNCIENLDENENITGLADLGTMTSPMLDQQKSAVSILFPNGTPSSQQGMRLASARSTLSVSARARSRLIKNMLESHPIVTSIEDTYNKMLKLKENLLDWMKEDSMWVEEKQLLENLKLEEIVKDIDGKGFESNIEKMVFNSSWIMEGFQSIIPKLLKNSGSSKHMHDFLTFNNDYNFPADMIKQFDSPIQELSPENDKSREDSNFIGLVGYETSLTKEILDGKDGPLANDYKVLIYKHGKLEQEYKRLVGKLESMTQMHEYTMQQSTQKTREMQVTIEQLELQLSRLNPEIRLKEEEFIFTRLDVEYNQQMLRRGLYQRRLDQQLVRDIDETMEEYVCIPLTRLIRLVRRYVHHTKMKNIEKAVESLGLPAHDVKVAMQQMECLQNVRISRWDLSSAELASKRIRLAKVLLERLRDLEKQSGIFLIKPYKTWQSNSTNGTNEKACKENKPVKMCSSHSKSGNIDQFGIQSKRLLLNNNPTFIWKPDVSTTADTPSQMSRIPKILELEVNRAMYSENQISFPLHPAKFRTQKDNQLNLISYMTVDRPIGITDTKVENGILKRPRALPALKQRVSLLTEE
ncbi:rootletin-like isoform X3 [Hydractinia symbiolongicarpus]|uniref:rootletin-like isoform X3 n=1 Tax=Hydractinia symbiolongicarpus TaxID=13093 RepID=UPI00254AF422|nr:rootletin-like isoform X3 [Hydractinia symbiolongicarpus]